METGKSGNLETTKDKIKIIYMQKFGKLPPIPMIQCSGVDDPQYIKMLSYCIRKNKPVDDIIEEKFFPSEDDAIY